MSEHAVTMRTATAGAAASGEITPEQHRAMGLLASGKTATDAAAGAGVSRTTLYRWMRDDPAFVAAWHAWQRDLRQATRAALLGLTGEAIASLRTALQKGDGRMALAMLKGMGLLAEQPGGSEDAELVGEQMELARREELLKVRKREFHVKAEELIEGSR